VNNRKIRLLKPPPSQERGNANFYFTKKLNMKRLIYFIIIFSSISLFGQINYSGFIDKYPIKLLADINTSGNSYGMYVYTVFDDPITLEGNLEKEKLIFFEKDAKGNKRASITFGKFNAESDTIEGI
jgi:hypothetical protein